MIAQEIKELPDRNIAHPRWNRSSASHDAAQHLQLCDARRLLNLREDLAVSVS
jgi:hypothetical protein